MNIHEEDYPYSIYKRPEGDELLDAHNDIIAVFDSHTEPEIEYLIAAAPEMVTLLNAALCEMQNPYAEKWITSGTRMVANNIAALLRRIEGADPE